MNRQIKILGIVIMVCYSALFIKLNQIQVFDASKLNDQPKNTRQQIRDFNSPRGEIVTSDGIVVANSKETKGGLRYQRVYPGGDLYAHITGYFSFRLGSTGVERVYNAELTGRTTSLQLHELSGIFADRSSEGDVILTVDSRIQQAAKDALGDLEGAVVAVEPQTGAILGMYSNPSFDPNVISSNEGSEAADVKKFLDAIEAKPLRSRAYQERYFPGSTFKVVTAAAGLESGKVTETEPDFPAVTSYTPPGTSHSISNFDGSTCGGTLFKILEKSCNSSFAQMGAEVLGPPPLIKSAEAAGFNSPVPIDLTGPVQSVFPTDFGDIIRRPEGKAPVYENTALLAQAAIGQNDVSSTPLQMAMIAAGVANGGSIMVPHVMSEIRARDGDLVSTFDKGEWRRFVTAKDAEILRRAMLGVVTDGTASSLKIPGVDVGGKTGTAQLGTVIPKSHAWIISFAGPPGGQASVAVAVIVQNVDGESGSTGGRVAGPIAKKVLEAALAR
ncbi:MAG TPA: penicillin-binding transpeptidase domain-containing protein [Microthrixaceae bacterium]|nr:penicillin-binding transpeptidase domain-containing protein [Microthrixaceae bacterium]